jgi:hypothetical protein
MYYPKEPEEPSGCMQTLVITRVMFSLLAVPVAIIAGALFALVFTFYIYTVSAPLALVPLAIGVGGVFALYRWEKAKVDKEMLPPDDRR